jgi:hypothetical protein
MAVPPMATPKGTFAAAGLRGSPKPLDVLANTYDGRKDVIDFTVVPPRW